MESIFQEISRGRWLVHCLKPNESKTKAMVVLCSLFLVLLLLGFLIGLKCLEWAEFPQLGILVVISDSKLTFERHL